MGGRQHVAETTREYVESEERTVRPVDQTLHAAGILCHGARTHAS
jgi:hypothetical protein